MDKDELLADYSLGKDAEELIESELGRYIIARVEEERAEASLALSTVLPWRRRKIQQLQNEIWRCDTFKGWLADLVVRGKQAEHQLTSDD